MNIERITGEGLAAWSIAMTMIVGLLTVLTVWIVLAAAHSAENPTLSCPDGEQPVEIVGEAWCTPIIILGSN